ncbi:MAG: hypothetical protein A4E52_01470 [Pelotomaculum sp. PtaB.Bin013]|nr:MAG: hypothetical protein A4E52_01470 [Pelotomaculum sp. PtaB.Bin013]
MIQPLHKFRKGQRTVVESGRQPEAVLHQGLLAGAVPFVHAAHLWYRHVGLVNKHDKILGKVVQQGIGSLSRRSSRQMPRIVFNPAAEPHLPHHFKIVVGALLQTLRFKQFFFRAQLGQPLFQLSFYGYDSPVHPLPGGGVVACRKDRHVLTLPDYFPGQHIELEHLFHFVTEKIHPDCLFRGGHRENLQHVAPHPELPPDKINIVALVLDAYQFAQDSVPVIALPLAQGENQRAVLLGITQAVNTGNTGHDNHVPPLKESASGRVAQFIYFFIDGRVLLNVSIGMRNICFRLVVVIIADKILHRVVGKELFKLPAKLGSQCLVRRQD